MSRAEQEPTHQDEAARAGWLSYVGGLTQDQIAAELGISRQRAQRLVSRAMAEGLIHVRLNHHIAGCLDLEAALQDRFGLTRVRVMPSLGAQVDPVRSVAPAAAAEMERFLAKPQPLTIALGTGRSLRAMVDAMERTEAVQHRLVSLNGNIAPDGSASFFDVVMRLADKVNAPHYPMPVPVVSPTEAETAAYHAMPAIRRVRNLATNADVIFVGIGQMSDDAPVFKDGFVSRAELNEMQASGAAGEIAGWVYDIEGNYLDIEIHRRTGGVRVMPGLDRPAIGVAAGAAKVPAIYGALKRRIINSLITDETTGQAVLAMQDGCNRGG